MKRALALFLLAGFVAPAWAQNFDGEWRGRITCDVMPGTQGRLNSEFVLRVAGGRASFERAINTAEGYATGNLERGEGPVAADGQVTITGRGNTRVSNYRSSYTGRITGNRMQLTGAQDWAIGSRAGTFHRPCQINLTRQ